MSARLVLDARRAREFFHLDVRLVDIISSIVLPGWPPPFAIVTSIYRTREEDRAVGGSGVHSTKPHRAIDIAAHSWDETAIRDVVNAVNLAWEYDPERPAMLCAVYKPHGTGPHVHFQVHPRTMKRAWRDGGGYR